MHRQVSGFIDEGQAHEKLHQGAKQVVEPARPKVVLEWDRVDSKNHILHLRASMEPIAVPADQVSPEDTLKYGIHKAPCSKA